MTAPHPGAWAFDVPVYGLPEFQCDVVGRAVSGSAEGQGSWGMLFLAKDRGFQVLINRRGELFVQPSFWTAEKYPEDLRIGPITHPAIRPDDQFNLLQVSVRKRRVDILVNSTRVCEPIPFDYDLDIHKLEMGLLGESGDLRVELDRLVVRELAAAASGAVASALVLDPMPMIAPPASEPASTPDGPRLGDVIYSDDFRNPDSGWNREDTPMGPGLRPFLRDYDADNGLYFLEAPSSWLGAEAWDCTGPLDQEFQIEAVGRVFGVGASPGGWGLIIVGADGRGLQVGIERQARLAVDPAFWGTEKYPNDPHYVPPLAHPAIKAGSEWNTLTVRVRSGRWRCSSTAPGWPNPSTSTGTSSPRRPRSPSIKPNQGSHVRAEFDRVEIRALLDP